MAINMTKELFEELKALESAILDEDGNELCNPVPLEVPEGFRRPPTLEEQINRVIRVRLSRVAEEQAIETFDEANDLDIVDEFEAPLTNTVFQDMVEEVPVGRVAEVKSDPAPTIKDEPIVEPDANGEA